jgi:hypothetical protein
MSDIVPLVGVHEAAPPTTTAARFPHTQLVGPYFLGRVQPAPTLLTRLSRALEPVWAAGLTPTWTFKPDPAAVAKGLWDRQLEDLRDGLTGASFAYPWHEPEDNMPPDVFTPMLDRVWRHLRSDRLRVGYVAGSWPWRPGDPRTTHPDLWRPAGFDFLGVDVYSGQSFPATTTLADHPGFQRWWRELAQGGPFMITERGFQAADCETRCAAMADEAAWLANPAIPCTGYVLWNTPGADTDQGWLLDADCETAGRDLLQALRTRSMGYQQGYAEGYCDGYGDAAPAHP